MRVRLKTLMAGPEGSFPPGTVVNFPDDQGGHLVASGQAEAVETASLLPLEAAVSSASGQAVVGPVETRARGRRRR